MHRDVFPIALLLVCGLAGVIGLVGLGIVLAGIPLPPERRRRWFALGASMTVIGSGAILAILGTA
jgi:cytochrome c biogenesis protein CcdA